MEQEESGSDDDSGSDSGSERNKRRDSMCSGEEIDEPRTGSNQAATRKVGNEDNVQNEGSKGVMTAKEEISSATASHPASPCASSKVFPKLQRGSKSFSSFSASHATSSAALSVMFCFPSLAVTHSCLLVPACP